MGTMTSIHLTSSNEIRRVLVAACVIFTLGIAGTVVGRAASSDEAKKVPSLAAAVEVSAVEVSAGELPAVEIEEPAVQLPAATIAPEITNETPVNGRDLLSDRTVAVRAEVTPLPAPAAVLPVAATPKLRTIEMEVTAYCPCKKCCGPLAQGITASGKRVSYNDGKFVAADRSIKFGTKLIIPGYASSNPVEVTDRGGAIKGNKLDVYFHSHTEALKWGRQKLTVTVVE